jgi:TolA-binding protein
MTSRKPRPTFRSLLAIWARGLSVLALLPLALPATAQWDLVRLPEVPVQIQHPPDLGFTVSRIAFADPTGKCSREYVDALMADFLKSDMEIVEREKIRQVLEEINFSASGMIRAEDIKPLGEFLGPSTMIWVDVQRCNVKQTRQCKRITTKESSYLRYTAKTTFDFKASLRIVDVVSGKIESAKTVSETKEDSDSSKDGYPDYPSGSELQDAAMHDAVRKVHHMILPWRETLDMRFFTTDKCNLKAAYQLVRIGDYAGAQNHLLNSLETCPTQKKVKDKHIARAHYNLGVTRMLLGQHSEALPSFRKAFSMRPGGDQIRDGINNCQRAIAVAGKMQGFLANPHGNGAPLELKAVQVTDVLATTSPSTVPENGTPEERLTEIKALLAKGLINQEDYDEKKKIIISDM